MKLLYERYIELKQWDVIAREMGLNSRWIFETHNRALENVYEKNKTRHLTYSSLCVIMKV